MPSGRDSFRRNRVAPFTTPISYHFDHAATPELSSRSSACSARTLKLTTNSLRLASNWGTSGHRSTLRRLTPNQLPSKITKRVISAKTPAKTACHRTLTRLAPWTRQFPARFGKTWIVSSALRTNSIRLLEMLSPPAPVVSRPTRCLPCFAPRLPPPPFPPLWTFSRDL